MRGQKRSSEVEDFACKKIEYNQDQTTNLGLDLTKEHASPFGHL